MNDLIINSLYRIPEQQLEWSFSRSSGPGGQNVNKVNSKATLRWQPEEDFLPPAAWRRFQVQASRYLTENGQLVIQSQQFRDQAKNLEACRKKLRNLILSSLVAPRPRIPTKPSKAAKARRLNDKKQNSDRKSARRGSWSGD